MPFRFWSFGWDSFWFVWMIFICLGFDGFWLCFGQQRMVHKTWDDGKEQNCCQDYKTFPLLTTSKSVIIKDPHNSLHILCLLFMAKSWLRLEPGWQVEKQRCQSVHPPPPPDTGRHETRGGHETSCLATAVPPQPSARHHGAHLQLRQLQARER